MDTSPRGRRRCLANQHMPMNAKEASVMTSRLTQNTSVSQHLRRLRGPPPDNSNPSAQVHPKGCRAYLRCIVGMHSTAVAACLGLYKPTETTASFQLRSSIHSGQQNLPLSHARSLLSPYVVMRAPHSRSGTWRNPTNSDSLQSHWKV